MHFVPFHFGLLAFRNHERVIAGGQMRMTAFLMCVLNYIAKTAIEI
jgi:hypothetical protein